MLGHATGFSIIFLRAPLLSASTQSKRLPRIRHAASSSSKASQLAFKGTILGQLPPKMLPHSILEPRHLTNTAQSCRGRAPVVIMIKGSEHGAEAVDFLGGQLVGGHVEQQALQAGGASETLQARQHHAAELCGGRAALLADPGVRQRLCHRQPRLWVLVQHPAPACPLTR